MRTSLRPGRAIYAPPTSLPRRSGGRVNCDASRRRTQRGKLGIVCFFRMMVHGNSNNALRGKNSHEESVRYNNNLQLM